MSDVSQNVGTTAGFAPAAYRSAIINDLMTQVGTDLSHLEIRIRRAANVAGTEFQEARWRHTLETVWSWDFDNGASGFPVQYTVKPSVLNASSFFDPTGQTRNSLSTPDFDSENDATRIFTFPWGGHNNEQGFSFGSAVQGVDNDDPNTFLWEFTTEGHALPYTEIFIRSTAFVNAVPEPSSASLLGVAMLAFVRAARMRRRRA